MNKKVTLSLLSATVFASMAASAFAAPTQGVYMGGSVDKFYKLDNLFNLSEAARKVFAANLDAANTTGDFKNLVFVDFDGKGAKISEIFEKGTLAKAKRDLTKADFEGSYVTINPDGTPGASYDPRNDAIDGAPGELKVESVSAIDKNTVEVAFNAEVDPTKVIVTNFTILDKDSAYVGSVNKAILSSDKKKVTLTVPDITAGNHPYTLVVNKNAFALDNNIFPISLSVDAPVVTTVTVDSKNQLTVGFDKSVSEAASGSLTDAVTVVNLTDSTKTYTATATVNNGKLVVTTSQDLIAGHNYKVTVNKDVLVDSFGTKNAAVEKTFLVATNETKPAVTNVRFVKSESGEIDALVTFNIPVFNKDGNILIQLQNRTDFNTSTPYAVTVYDSKSDAAIVAARVKDLKLENNQILLTHVNAQGMDAGKEYGVIIAAGEVKDTTLAALENDKTTGSATFNIDIVAPTVVAKELVSATEIKLTLSESVTFDSSKSVKVAGFKADGASANIDATVTLSADGKTATLKPKTQGEFFVTDTGEHDLLIDADAFTDAAGNKFTGLTTDLSDAVDKAKPALVTAKFSTDVITLTFTEAVSVADAAAAKDIVVDGKRYGYSATAEADKWDDETTGVVSISGGAAGSQVIISAGTVKDAEGNTNGLVTVTAQ